MQRLHGWFALSNPGLEAVVGVCLGTATEGFKVLDDMHICGATLHAHDCLNNHLQVFEFFYALMFVILPQIKGRLKTFSP